MANSFTRRHYEAIAEVMQATKPLGNFGNEQFIGSMTQWQFTVVKLADAFANDYPGFLRGRFMRACEPGANVKARGGGLLARRGLSRNLREETKAND